MRIAVFGGSFDPVHQEHVNFVRAAVSQLALDRVFVVPSFRAPHKSGGAHAGGADRLEMCRIAFRTLGNVTVSDCELSQGGTSYTYLTCRRFAAEFPQAERFFLVGADMLEDFFTWKNPRDVLSCVTLAACGREGEIPSALKERFRAEFGRAYVPVNYVGERVSSTEIRVALAFGKEPKEIDEDVLRYICERGLYRYPAVLPALSLEKPERREHSFRVAQMACARARSLGVSEEKALLASALHDCAKYVPLSSPLLKGFTPPENVPLPVLHQYTGAYLAEHEFGITDEEILDAVRYHTSGRENMTALGKLIFLADLLEEGRDFGGIGRLRELFWSDLDECLLESLKNQTEYLKSTGKPVYPLTERAYEWIKSNYGK